MKASEVIDRKEFFSRVGIGIGAIVLTHCLSSCSASKDDEPGPSSGGKVNFNLNLNDQANTKLKQNGGFLYKDGLIIARAKDGTFIAVSQSCTHQGTPVDFDLAGNRFHCSNHGSNFGLTGNVINGPAASPLKAFKTKFDSATNVLTISE